MDLEEIENVPDDGPSPETVLTGSEATMELYRHMQRLDPVSREVMYLRLIGDLGYREIGEILGKTETWARVTYYRGKEKMKKGRESI